MTGKLALAATANTRPTMNAMFWFSKTRPRPIASRLSATVAIFEARTSSASLARPRPDRSGVEIAAHRRRTRQGEAGYDGQDSCERDRRDEPEQQEPPIASARCSATILAPPTRPPPADMKRGSVERRAMAPKPRTNSSE